MNDWILNGDHFCSGTEEKLFPSLPSNIKLLEAFDLHVQKWNLMHQNTELVRFIVFYLAQQSIWSSFSPS